MVAWFAVKARADDQADGSCRLPSVSRGPVLIGIRTPNGTFTLDHWDVPDGGDARHEIRMPRTKAIELRTRTPNGSPVGGVSVSVCLADAEFVARADSVTNDVFATDWAGSGGNGGGGGSAMIMTRGETDAAGVMTVQLPILRPLWFEVGGRTVADLVGPQTVSSTVDRLDLIVSLGATIEGTLTPPAALQRFVAGFCGGGRRLAVRLRASESDPRSVPGTRALDEVPVDDLGRFSIAHVPVGTWSLQLVVPGDMDGEGSMTSSVEPPLATLTLAGDESVQRAFDLTPVAPVRIHGRATLDGTALGDGLVVFRAARVEQRSGVPARLAVTRANGEFTAFALPGAVAAEGRRGTERAVGVAWIPVAEPRDLRAGTDVEWNLDFTSPPTGRKSCAGSRAQEVVRRKSCAKRDRSLGAERRVASAQPRRPASTSPPPTAASRGNLRPSLA